MTRPTVSVVIPLYNHQQYIVEALHSVFNQTYAATEIIIIDDGSTDASAQVVSAIAEVRQNIIFWRHENRGAHSTINTGIQRATGDLVAILNSDDLYEATRLDRAVQAFRRCPDLEAVFSALSFIDDHGRPIPNAWYEEAKAFYEEHRDFALGLVHRNFIMTTSNIIAKRDLFANMGAFSDLRYAHDLDFFLRLAARGRQFEILDEPLVFYRLHSTNTIKESEAKVKVEWAAAVAMHLHTIWSRAGGDHWSSCADYLEVLRRNKLTELTLLFLAYFNKHQVQSLERADWRRDTSFMTALRSADQ